MDIEITGQRAYTLDESWLIGKNEAEKRNIAPQFKLLHQTQDSISLGTYLCAANHHPSKLSFLGGGSGFTRQSKVKAFYESLEKAISYQQYQNGQIDTYEFSTETSPSTEYLIKQRLLPKPLLEKPYVTQDFPWVKLTQYINPKKTIFYPLNLIYNFVNETTASLNELCNPTGLAIGANALEAIIHGMNQWVERDAYSLFLLKTILHKNPTPARMVMKETLPEELAKIVQHIERMYQENLIIVDISSDSKWPAFAVSFTQQNMLLQPQGFGASIAKELALQQALFEVMQYKDRFNTNAEKYHKDSLVHFVKMPLLLKAMQGDIAKLIQQNHYIPVEWQDIMTYSLDKHLETQVQFMVKLLSDKGANTYTTTLYQSSTGVAITYTLIPELECFGMIRDGKFSALKPRGLEALQC
jgi:ribosomal protein S12 methylthiotransferase accessory factor